MRARAERLGFRPIHLATIVRAELAGWAWIGDPRCGPHGRALRSRHGAIYEVRMWPLAVRAFQDVRFKEMT